jgi:hypothetical protein
MELRDLLDKPPRLHQVNSGDLVSWGLAEDVLRFIEARVTASSVTLETGAGLSTIMFALKGTDHTCVTPNRAEVAHIKQYCQDHGISTDKLRFYIVGSEKILPHLASSPLDLVLIDGRHAFPAPFIDWYYTAERLNVGGLLVIDDIQIWTGRVLQDFLLAEPEWELCAEFPARAVVFTKILPGSHEKEWMDQPYTVHNSTMHEGRDIVALAERVDQMERAYAETAAYARRLEAVLQDNSGIARLLARRVVGRLRYKEARARTKTLRN